MFDEIKVLTHSSIRIQGEKTLYFDPYEIGDESHDADIIFVTHDHYDHYSPKDIAKIVKSGTILVLPESMKGQEGTSGIKECVFIHPGASIDLEGTGITVNAVPAYNKLKPFHPKGKQFTGYIVTMSGVSYYVAGDTDALPELSSVKCDVALVPVGGKFTMDYKDAAKLVNLINPKLAIPTHYGSIVGTIADGRKFKELVNDGIEVRLDI